MGTSMVVRGTAEEVRAAQWAERLFRKKVPAGRAVPEPRGPGAVCAAVETFARLAAEAGVMQDSVTGARRGAKRMSTDRLQGLSEVVQNAEDLGASEVRLLVRERTLLIAHNGRPVRLTDVIPLSMPWVTSKAQDAEATGRFGIGLMTLFTFSPSIEVHSGHYRLRIAESGVGLAPARTFPPHVGGEGWTVFRVPLTDARLTAADVDAWLSAWGNEALLFLRRVADVVHLDVRGRVRQRLALHRRDGGAFTADIAGEAVRVEVSEVLDPDGLRWQVCATAVTTPPDVEPESKAAGDTTPLAVALPLGKARTGTGHVHVRLPVTPLGLPLRVHAPFDPAPSRQDLRETEWNDALVRGVADLWAAALVERFRHGPAASWRMLPLPQEVKVHDGVVGRLESTVLRRSREQVSVRLRIDVPGHGPLKLADLAVEAPELGRVLTEADIEQVAQSPALPHAARDPEARYRDILGDWADHGGAEPVDVGVREAMALLGDPERQLDAVIELAAVGAATGGLTYRLCDFAWVEDDAGTRRPPPGPSDLRMFADRRGGLAESLGFAYALHPAFLAGTPAATRVREWLRAQNALLTDGDQVTVIRRLATYGRRGGGAALPLTDEQLRLLKDAFVQVPERDRPLLGGDIGRIITLGARHHDAEGKRHDVQATPAGAYLPPGIDSADRDESFAHAAGTTPGLAWLRPRYHDVLRSGGSGMSPLNFLRLLGARTAPGVRAHRHRRERLQRQGVHTLAPGSPKSRTRRMSHLGATYTLDDHESPDLDAVVRSIAAEPDGPARRKRAVALLHVLGRAWNSSFSDHESVEAAHDYYVWDVKARIPGFWLWTLRETPWLDSESGTATAPSALRRRTEATAAVYGTDADGLLHRDIQAAAGRRGEVLRALAVGGEPTAADILERLRRQRRSQRAGGDHDHAAALLLYRALAVRTGPPRGPSATGAAGGPAADVSRADIARAFAEGDGLVLTESGWRTPGACLRGKPLFGELRDFAPAFDGGDALWEAVGVPRPGADDAIAVIRRLVPAKPGGRRTEPDAAAQAVLLQSLQFLQELAAGEPEKLRGKRLGRLPLWTSHGWTGRRPVYAVEEAGLAAALTAAQAPPVWCPGAELEQFRDLLPHLGITVVGGDAIVPYAPGPPDPDAHATARLSSAVAHLREDLQRSDPATARELQGSWDELTGLVVHIEPALACTVALPGQPDPPGPLRVPVQTAIDWDRGTLYARDDRILARSGGVGRALAARFRARRREVAHAWSAAWERADSGPIATEIVRAEDRIEERRAAADAEHAQRLAEFHQETNARHASAGRARTAKPKPPAVKQPGAPSGVSSAAVPPRRLVDPGLLRPVLDRAVITGRSGRAAAGATGSGPARPTLSGPRAEPAVPQQRSTLKAFSALDQEAVALDLVRLALARDDEDLRDLRAQRGLGADAADELSRFYEVKSFLRREPDSLSVTPHEYERAATEKDFFLVVVSGLEDGAGERATVRIILDPLRELAAHPSANVTLTGVRGCRSFSIPFERAD
ncbi:hypothetical protein AB0L68_12450 [Streptomyces sp. NPDC052164]|uniref:sacsin N-terminal ATP-binding-like domain-containing protein n=1 Tax=Streptomyces sp. NPDC052164 TaxID=3155529 RepID=UPI0034179CBA